MMFIASLTTNDHNQILQMKVKLTLLLLMTATWLRAQESSGGQQFTLEQCMEYAHEHAFDIQNSRLDEASAQAKVKETVGIGLPQVTGSVSAQKSPTLQRFFGTSPAPGVDSTGFGLTPRDADRIGASEGDVYAAQNFFQLQAAGDANISINQLIFNGSYIVGLQASQAYKDLATKQRLYVEGERKAAVAKAYFNVLINKDRLELYASNLERLKEVYDNTVALNKNGFAESIEVDRLKVALNNAQSEIANLEALSDLSLSLLKFQMNFPQNEDLELLGSINDVKERAIASYATEIEFSERRDYEVLIANKHLQELNIKNKYAEALPYISAFATFGQSTQSATFTGLFKTESGFSDNGYIGPDKWYGYSTVGLRLGWNIFTGLQRTYQIQQEKIELQKIENNIDAMQAQIQIEVQDSESSLSNSLRRLAVQEENLKLAERIFDISQKKYEEGVGSNLEVVDANNSLKEAQTNYYNTLFEAIIARIDLSRALGVEQ